MKTVVTTETVSPSLGSSDNNKYAAEQYLASCPTCALLRALKANGVNWSSTLTTAREQAVAQKSPYAIYVCSESAMQVVGEVDAVRAKYKLEHSGVLPAATIFDDKELVVGLQQAGVGILVKIPKSDPAARGISENTLQIFSPTDEKLAELDGANCNRNTMLELIQSFPQTWKRWVQRQANQQAGGK